MGKELGATTHQSDGDLFTGREDAYVFSVFLDLRHHGGDALLDFGTHGLPIASVVTIGSS
jgi:hypothetical protein